MVFAPWFLLLKSLHPLKGIPAQRGHIFPSSLFPSGRQVIRPKRSEDVALLVPSENPRGFSNEATRCYNGGPLPAVIRINAI